MGVFKCEPMIDKQQETTSSYSFQTYALGEQAITLEFGNEISEETAEQINSFKELLSENLFPGFKTTVSAYTTLTVFYHLMEVLTSDLVGTTCFEKVSNYLHQLKKSEYQIQHTSKAVVTIPVCYDEKFGIDLREVAQINKLTVNEVIEIHAAARYRVFMIGFTPGFAYLGGMDRRIASPRKSTPRLSLPAGAVGIAGNQTGIYPLKTPGGWQIIGQTPLKMFDIHRDQPSFLNAGDEVMFKPISMAEFNELSCQ